MINLTIDGTDAQVAGGTPVLDAAKAAGIHIPTLCYLGNARKLLDKIKRGDATYHFIELMACPGGCVSGGGQPVPASNTKRRLRASALYNEDRELKHRKSHDNPAIKAIYEQYLKEPLGHKSHTLLHTKYTPRNKQY